MLPSGSWKNVTLNAMSSQLTHHCALLGTPDCPGFDEPDDDPDEDPATPDEDPTTPDEEPVTPDEEPVSPDEEPVTPDEEPVTPDEEPVTPDEEPVSPEDLTRTLPTTSQYRPRTTQTLPTTNRYRRTRSRRWRQKMTPNPNLTSSWTPCPKKIRCSSCLVQVHPVPCELHPPQLRGDWQSLAIVQPCPEPEHCVAPLPQVPTLPMV